MSDFLDSLKEWSSAAKDLAKDVSSTALQLNKDAATISASRTLTQAQANYTLARTQQLAANPQLINSGDLWSADGINRALANVSGDNTRMVLLIGAALIGAFLILKARS